MKTTTTMLASNRRKPSTKTQAPSVRVRKQADGLENYSPDVQQFLRLARKLKGAFTA